MANIINQPYQISNKMLPTYAHLKDVNAKFLHEYIFHGQIPIKIEYPRTAIKKATEIIVAHPQSILRPAGTDYYVGQSQYSSATGKSPYIIHGVQATGHVEITVVSTNPKERDKYFTQVIAAYYSPEGRCWFANRRDVTIHGYNLVSSYEREFVPDLDGGQDSYLYSATLKIDFQYDIVTTTILQYITGVDWYFAVDVE